MKIKCDCTTCIYCKNNSCSKTTVEVEGLFSKSIVGTFCNSFVNKKSFTSNESNGLFMPKLLDKNTKLDFMNKTSCQSVSCDSNYCKHLKDGKCTKKSIIIHDYMNGAKYRSETECHSFELQKGW